MCSIRICNKTRTCFYREVYHFGIVWSNNADVLLIYGCEPPGSRANWPAMQHSAGKVCLMRSCSTAQRHSCYEASLFGDRSVLGGGELLRLSVAAEDTNKQLLFQAAITKACLEGSRLHRSPRDPPSLVYTTEGWLQETQRARRLWIFPVITYNIQP